MRISVFAAFLMLCTATAALPAPKGPEVDLVDNRLSVNADNIPLARLLRLLDIATGMQSKVPADLANRNISVQFSGLGLNDGLRKVFQGQPFDYVIVEGQGVIVTAASQTAGTPESVPAYNPAPAYNPGNAVGAQPFPQQTEQPFVQDLPAVLPQPLPNQPQQQPAMIQTPFGPIANPRATQPGQQVPQPAPQPNPLFPGQPTNQQPVTGVQGAQQAAPVTPSPFGTLSPFGTPQSSPNLFGSPTVFSAPGGAQPRQ